MDEPAPGAIGGALPKIALRIMATTDVHMHILPFDYVTRSPSVTSGLARTASLIRTARAEASNALLFDNGDFLHGNPMSDALSAEITNGLASARGSHPIIAAMKAMGVDAITLGNHDFDFGPDFLGAALLNAPFPVVVSNLSLHPETPGDGPRLAPATEPFTLLERTMVDDAGAPHVLRIGVLGFLPPGSITGLRSDPFRVEIRDIVETARLMVPSLRALGADLVVALAHSGIGAERDAPGLENAAIPLAAVPGIDVIVSGHSHQVFPDATRPWPSNVDPLRGTIHGTPVVAPGFWGSHLGVVDLTLVAGRESGWSVHDAQVEVRPITVSDPETGALRANVAPDKRLLKLLDRLHRRMVLKSAEPIGETRVRLHSHFAAVAPSPALDVVHRAKTWWGKRAVAGTPLGELAILSSTSPFKAGGLGGAEYFTDIPPGPITRAALSDLYPHPNTLCGLRLSGFQLIEWLERAAGIFNRIVPGKGDQPLLAGTTPIYNFETVAGCSYEIDLSAPPRYGPDGTLLDPSTSRIKELRIGDTPVRPFDEVLLLTNSYRISGGGNYPLPGRERIVLDEPVGLREILTEYLASQGPFDESPAADWHFTPIDRASACFTSSSSAPDVPTLKAGRIVAGRDRPDGFRAYRLAFETGVSYMPPREVGAGRRLANPVRSGRKQP